MIQQFNTRLKELKKKRKELNGQEREGWEKQQKWEEEEDKKCYQRFLGDYRVSDFQLKKWFPYLDDLLKEKTNFFYFLYHKPPFVVEESEEKDPIKVKMIEGSFVVIPSNKIIIKAGGKEPTSTEREEFLQLLFKKALELNAKRLAAIYELDGDDDWRELFGRTWEDLEKKTNLYNLEKNAGLLHFYKLLMRNVAVDMVREKTRNPVISSELLAKKEQEEVEEQSGNINMGIITAPSLSDKIDLKLALAKITPEYGKLIQSIFFDGFNQEEIAKQQRISQQAISKRLNKALGELGKWL